MFTGEYGVIISPPTPSRNSRVALFITGLIEPGLKL
jgi:hypothetical protein